MKVKKFILSCLAAVAVFGLSAQEAEKTENVFVPHWYVQGQFGAQYTLGEVSFGKLMAPNAQLTFGRQFSELLGARFGVNAWQSKAGQADARWAWNYVAPSLDGTFNISNAICGYNPDRLFSLSAIAGLGLNVTFGNDKAATANDDLKASLSQTGNFPDDALEYLWDGTKAFLNGHVGLAGDFRITNNLSAGIEVQAVTLSDKYNSKQAGNSDWYFNALAGVKYCFGKTHERRAVEPTKSVEEIVQEYVDKKVAPMEEKVNALEKDLEETKAAQDKVIAEAVAAAEREAAQPFQRDIVFGIGSAKITKSEMGKVSEIADYMKQHPTTVVLITGYADNATGTDRVNMHKSELRANAVAKALKEEGIAESRMTIDFKGASVQPYGTPAENRVAICIVQK